jgi:hypothetical protein
MFFALLAWKQAFRSLFSPLKNAQEYKALRPGFLPIF